MKAHVTQGTTQYVGPCGESLCFNSTVIGHRWTLPHSDTAQKAVKKITSC